MAKKRMKNGAFLGIWVPALVVTGGLIIGTEIACSLLGGILDTYAGTVAPWLAKGDVVKTKLEGTENWNAKYYEEKYDDRSSEAGTGSAKAYAAAQNCVEEINNEGMVLLKNKDNKLPLTETGITLLGRGSADPVYGGSGSGNVDVTTCASPKTGLEKAGFTVNEDAYNFFNNQKDNYYRQVINMDTYSTSTFFIGEVPTSEYTFTPKKDDVAVVFISRCGGEGLDLSTNLKRDIQNDESAAILSGDSSKVTTANQTNFAVRSANAKKEVANYADGQHQLELSKEEKDMIAFAKTNYAKTIVVLNDSTTMEVGDLQDDDGIDGIIWAGSPGSTGFNALGSILKGTVNPSGKTPDLYSRDFTADPTFPNFAINSVNEYINVPEDMLAGDKSSKKAHFVEYEEGIYVGYRYYETRFGENEQNYKNAVVYPFGYGLSYTTFAKEIVDSSTNGNTVTLKVKVTNTGNTSGKEVVQAYYTAPYKAGGIEKSSTILGDFAKTKLLASGETDTVTLSIAKDDMASYDYNDANGNGFKGYELEEGDYKVQIKENSHTVSTDKNGNKLEISFHSDAKQLRRRESDEADVTNQFDNVSAIFQNKTGYATNFSRNDWTGTFPTAATDADADASKIMINGTSVSDLLKPYEVVNNDSDVMPTVGANNGLSTIDLRGINYDDEAYEQLLDQLTDEEYNKMSEYLGKNAYNTPAIESLNKPATEDHDGPQGFSSLFGKYKNICAWMSEPLLAATFNKELGKKMGQTIGDEALMMNPVFSGWYGPGANTHRSPFAGRNFEYYSEDGTLAGKIASEVVSGAADKGVYSFIKHFALNDQETWRTASICTWANEQAIREVYLKPFEIVMKTAKTTIDYISDSEGNHSQKEMRAATAVMSSFNKIGATWAGGMPELMTNVLRDEWGFRGVAISDFNLYEYMSPDQGTRAGTDMHIAFSKTYADTKSATARIALRKAMHNLLYTVSNSNAMQDVAPGTIISYKMSGWRKLFIATDIVLGVFFVAGLAWVIIRMNKVKNETAGSADTETAAE